MGTLNLEKFKKSKQAERYAKSEEFGEAIVDMVEKGFLEVYYNEYYDDYMVRMTDKGCMYASIMINPN